MWLGGYWPLWLTLEACVQSPSIKNVSRMMQISRQCSESKHLIPTPGGSHSRPVDLICGDCRLVNLISQDRQSHKVFISLLFLPPPHRMPSLEAGMKKLYKPSTIGFLTTKALKIDWSWAPGGCLRGTLRLLKMWTHPGTSCEERKLNEERQRLSRPEHGFSPRHSWLRTWWAADD